ncbi:hypothetical protein PHISP_01594 [Aspergillus sp. HF37]|nr:hypothetical protein PHISP_01594 [Aspergillus sp. HF37]
MTDGRSASSSVTMPYLPPRNLTVLQPEDLEKRLGEPSDVPQSRPMTSWTQAPSRSSSRLAGHGTRHIDLVEALFTSHRYRIESARTMSPTSPYNEDIAERNMTRFLRTQPKASLYSRFVSALYQEDVANKNIAESRKSSHSLSRPSSRSRPNMHGTPQSTPRSRKRNSGGHRDAQKRNSQLSRPVSQDGLHRPPVDESAAAAREQWRRRSHILRAQISEPNLSTENDASQVQALSHSVGQLPALPAYNGKRLSDSLDNTAVPIPPRGVKNIYEHRALSKATPSRSSSPAPSTPSSSTPKRNARDLSINTDLATRGKATLRVSHRAIQPPTPGNQDMRQNPSIAEVMNSPVPEETAAPISTAKVDEIMDMFRQAYVPTQAETPNTNTQATFETLQDAIIREVNSHEAFQRVPIPAPGPPFTPSSTRDAFDRHSTLKPPHPGLRRSISAKEGQFTKLIRAGSSKRHRRGSESRRSISGILPKSSDKLLRFAPGSARRRRHTDAPLPSAGFFDSDGSKQGNPHDQVTYMDLLMRSASQPAFPPHDPARNLSGSQSTASLSQKSPERMPSVYYMRAQTSASRESRTRFSASEKTLDDDDSIIHLPSAETPRAQVHGVDKNNVQYIVQNSTPSDAYRLMNWPQRRSPQATESDDESPIFNETNSFPLPPVSRPGQQLRASRSMETY